MTATTRAAPASTSVAIVAATVLGLSAGSMLNEAVVLVGFWRSLPAQEFLDWYADNAQRLSGYYGPLQIAAALSAITAAVLYRVRRHTGSGLLVLSAVLAVTALVTFFVYFKDVNASFAAGTIALDRVPAELARWSFWQWGRTAIGIGAFVSALFAVRSRDV
ncbi:MAG: hypothetical protein V3T72_12060 [Thermoanaerobaculia bacterium]